MGRPKIVRKAEEAAAIPTEQPIQVEFPPEGTEVVDAENKDVISASSSAKTSAKVSQQTDNSEEITTLKTQLEDMKKAAEESKRLAAESAQRESEARKREQEQGARFQTESLRANQAEMDAVLNAISAATSETDSATQDLQTAGEVQDWAAVAKAQAKLARAQTRLVQLEDGKIALEQRAERLKTESERKPIVHGDPVENHIDAMANLLPSQRTWLKNHRDLITDSKKNIRLQNAHLDAEDKGHPAGSDGYFQFLEERLGYRKAPVTQDDDVNDDTDDTPVIVGAPPSREPPSAGSGRPVSTRITLSAAEREAAAAAGVSDLDYAKNKMKLISMKKEGHYQ